MVSFSRSLRSHSFFAFKSNKRIPLCSHFFFSYHHFFFSVSTTFFSFIYFFFISLCSHFFSVVIIFFFSLNFIIQQPFFHYALIMLSRIYLFYFQFFHYCLRGTLTDISFLQLFQLQHQLFQILIFLHHYSLYK
jgi:hypothetical protein